MRLAMGRSATLLALLAMSQMAVAESLESALDAYVGGLRSGDITTLRKLFFSDGQFCSHRAAEIDCSSFAQVLPSWVAKPDPQARGKIRSQETIAETMAKVTYELDFNGQTYVDHLLLYKKQNQWLVVAKTTFLER